MFVKKKNEYCYLNRILNLICRIRRSRLSIKRKNGKTRRENPRRLYLKRNPKHEHKLSTLSFEKFHIFALSNENVVENRTRTRGCDVVDREKRGKSVRPFAPTKARCHVKTVRTRL